MYALQEMLTNIRAFMDSGGEVLYAIAILTFLMWVLIFERAWYFRITLRSDLNKVLGQWEGRSERRSWNARHIRRSMISKTTLLINENLGMIQTMVALCPLLGLLGTVWGMIEVFNIMAVTGGGEARAMASGVSKATIPTMAGMVGALSGVFANSYITRVAERESKLVADHLTTDH